MLPFISEINYLKHREAEQRDALRLSVLEKQLPAIRGRSATEIARLRKLGSEGAMIAELKASLELHRVYFASFSERKNTPSNAIKHSFGSEAALLNEMYTASMRSRFGFCALVGANSGLKVCASENALDILLRGEPLLAVDLCEHVYYGDWGFDKEAYLRAALPHLWLDKISAP